MRILSKPILFLLLCQTAFAQSNFEFSGYVNEFPAIQLLSSDLQNIYNSSESIKLNLTRVRVRPVLYIGEHGRLNIEAESSILIYDNLTGFFSAESQKSPKQIINLKWLINDINNLSIINFIDRLYYRHEYRWGEFTIGRQRIAWGTGRVWNPVDLFNPINPTTFYKIEKDGADALSAKIYMGDFSDLNLVFNPTEKISESNFGFRLRTNFSQNDISFISGRFDSKYVAGFDFAGNLYEAGIRAEGIYYFSNGITPFVKFIAGIDYQFTSKLYALLEYHYNGEGKNNKIDYEFNRLIKGEILNLNKNYLAFIAMYQLTPLLNVSLQTIGNLNDNSYFVSTTANYSWSQNLYLNIGGQYFAGDKLTEYWYYPNSLYLQIEYYF